MNKPAKLLKATFKKKKKLPILIQLGQDGNAAEDATEWYGSGFQKDILYTRMFASIFLFFSF